MDFSDLNVIIILSPSWFIEVHLWPSLGSVFLNGPSGRIDLMTIEMTHANFGACITICTIHPKIACYLLHYIPISTSHDGFNFSFLPRTIIAWNQLPSIIIVAPSLDAFRSRLFFFQLISSPVSHNPSTQLAFAIVQCTHKSHRLLYTPLLHSL